MEKQAPVFVQARLYLCVSSFQLRVKCPIFIKLGVETVPLENIPTPCLLIS
jgi:hypothetical protein